MTASVALIGSGIVGSLAALELARLGVSVHLFDRNAEPVSEASYFNEGKIHLGFLYAMDPLRTTSSLMIDGAVGFRGIVGRLAGHDVAESLSTSFLYAVHRDSLVSAAEFGTHLDYCTRRFDEVASRTGGHYVDGAGSASARRLPTKEWSDDLDPRVFTDVFQTSERAVDPRALAPFIQQAVHASELIEFHGHSHIDRIETRSDSRLTLVARDDDHLGQQSYDVVVNATWSDLLRLDRQMGIEPPQEWSYRYKLGNRISVPLGAGDLPSVTVVLGAFGDLVNFGQGAGAFVSWYPHGRMHMTDAIDLPDWNAEMYAEERRDAFLRSMGMWQEMSPAFARLDLSGCPVDHRGGVILASGRADVNDPLSLLHSRVNVGITRRGNYLSVNTGKYTLGPLMAVRAARDVCNLIR